MVTKREIPVEGRPSSVWSGGDGETLLLLHGGYGGAEMHWAGAWDRLAERFRVIAPELPGVAPGTAPGPRSYDAFARWTERLLEALGVSSAWFIGNSFGATVAWQLASLAASRCKGLVLVDGRPPMHVPALLRRAIALPILRQLWTDWFRRTVFVPQVIRQVFADPSLAPPEFRENVAQRSPPQLDLVRDVLLAGHPPAPVPAVPVLIVWGEKDGLLGTRPADARRLQTSIPGSRLVFIPSAGHLPQVERPAEFVDTLTAFVGSPGASVTPSAAGRATPPRSR